MIRIARPKSRTLAMVALPVVAVAVTVPTVAMATAGSPDVFKGCLTSSGDLYGVALNPTSDPDCSGGLLHPAGTLISWNQQGVQGVQGAASTVPGPVGPTGLTGATGPQGPAGAAGAAGAPGKNGVSGYRMVKAVGKAKARTAATYTVMCKDGRMALGGGMNGTSDLILNGSSPTADAKGWIVRVTNVATKNRPVQVFVTCAFATN
ncbi:MAG TPA: hypothetical protein VMZ00_10325 [Sporichthya sp.]|nr:hypothetical protein [Sporichthya sp.]